MDRENPVNFDDVFDDDDNVHDSNIFVTADDLLEEFNEEDFL